MKNILFKFICLVSLITTTSEAFSKTILIDHTNYCQFQNEITHLESSEPLEARTLVSTDGNHVHFGLIFTNNKNFRIHNESSEGPYFEPDHIIIHWYGGEIRIHYGPLEEVEAEFRADTPEITTYASIETAKILKKDRTYFYLFLPVIETPNIESCSEFAGLILRETDFNTETVTLLLEVAKNAKDRDYKNRLREQFKTKYSELLGNQPNSYGS